jgi:hypothetical protein
LRSSFEATLPRRGASDLGSVCFPTITRSAGPASTRRVMASQARSSLISSSASIPSARSPRAAASIASFAETAPPLST